MRHGSWARQLPITVVSAAKMVLCEEKKSQYLSFDVYIKIETYQLGRPRRVTLSSTNPKYHTRPANRQFEHR